MSISKLYLTGKTPSFTPTNFRGTWNTTTGSVSKALDSVKDDGSGITLVGVNQLASTAPYDVLLYRGVSEGLPGQTISGNLDVVIGVQETAGDVNDVYHLHVYATAGDSDTVRGTLLSDYIENPATSEWPTTNTGKSLASAQALSSLAISDGDRIVVEIGYQATASAVARTGRVWYGTQDPTSLAVVSDLTAGSTSVTTLAGYVSFSSPLTELVIPTRITQENTELYNSGSKEVRVTGERTELFSSGSKEIRVTRSGVEVWSPRGTSDQRVTRLNVEIWSANTTQDFVQVFVNT